MRKESAVLTLGATQSPAGDLQSLAIERCVHEIRGLLISGNYARLLIDERAGPITALQKQYLQVILDNSRQIREVLSSLSWAADTDSWNVADIPLTALLRDVALAAGLRRCCSVRSANDAVCIRGDRQKLSAALMAVVATYHPGTCSLSVNAEKTRAWVTFADLPNSSVTDVQPCTSMSDKSRLEAGGEMQDARHILRIHGGSLAAESSGAVLNSLTIEFPVAKDSSDGVADA